MGNTFYTENSNKPESAKKAYRAPHFRSTDDDFLMKYAISRVIGDGTSATVQQATRMGKNPEEVAIKVIRKQGLKRDGAARVAQELKTWGQLAHKNIVRLIETYDTPSAHSFFTELCEKGDMLEYINAHGYFTEDEARKIFVQLLSAVEYCHSKGVIHRDLKLENVMLDKDGVPKIGDFGFANFYDVTLSTRLTEWCGSPPYAAPEIFTGKPYYGPEIDVWSLGVVLFAIVTGALPFKAKDFDELTSRVVSGRFDVPFFVSEACEHLLRGMLCVDPTRRLTIPQVLSDAWVLGDVASFTPLKGKIPESLTAGMPQSNVTVTKEALKALDGTNSGHKQQQPPSSVLVGGSGTSPGRPEVENTVPASPNTSAQQQQDPRRKLFVGDVIRTSSSTASSPSRRSPSRDSQRMVRRQRSRTRRVQGAPLMLFECEGCGAPNSARWNFETKTAELCPECTSKENASES